MSKRPLVLFSSGLDSTFLLYLKAKSGQPVDHFYIDGGQGERKIKVEEEARYRVIDALKKLFPDVPFRSVSTPVSKVKFADAVSAGWRQPLAWLVGALEVVDPSRHSCVEIGYVIGDEMTQQIHNLQTAWAALWPIVKIGEMVPLTFPLTLTSKFQIIEALPAEVYAATWSCELPIHDVFKGVTECGRCRACETRKLEVLRYKMRTGRDLEAVHAEQLAVIEAREKMRREDQERISQEEADHDRGETTYLEREAEVVASIRHLTDTAPNLPVYDSKSDSIVEMTVGSGPKDTNAVIRFDRPGSDLIDAYSVQGPDMAYLIGVIQIRHGMGKRFYLKPVLTMPDAQLFDIYLKDRNSWIKGGTVECTGSTDWISPDYFHIPSPDLSITH